jgi:hypothetical protein
MYGNLDPNFISKEKPVDRTLLEKIFKRRIGEKEFCPMVTDIVETPNGFEL